MRNCWIEFAAKDSAVYRTAEQDLALPAQHALIRTRLSVISPGTELALLHEEVLPRPHLQDKPRHYPAQPGYAAVGEVVESANHGMVKPGDRIFASLGHQLHGVVNLAQRNRWCRVPEGMADETAGLAALARIALSAPLAIDARYGHRVLVIGLGIVGYLAAQWFRNSCALTVEACDKDELRARFASERGIPSFPSAELDARAASAPYDIVVEATGAPSVIETAFRCVREGGGVVLLGTGRGKLHEFDMTNAIHRNLVTVVSAHTNRHDRAVVVGPPPPVADPLALAMDYLASGRLRCDRLVGKLCDPREPAEAYAALDRREYFTVAFDWRKAW
ncbi:MAG: zinc-binding dehydrogenase [Verrucomicrobiia bacterium]